MSRVCSMCGKEKPESSFYTKHQGNRCRSCHRADVQRVKLENAASWEGYTDEDIYELAGPKRCAKCKQERPASDFTVERGRSGGLRSYCKKCSVVSVACIAAAKKGLPVDINYRTLPDPPEKCPCCGVPMERGGSHRTSPSIDKLLPERGYTNDNVVWVCGRCNTIKNDASPAELYRVADFYWEVFRERGLPLPSTRLRPILED